MGISRTHAGFLRLIQGEGALYRRQVYSEFSRLYNKWAPMAKRFVDNPAAIADFSETLYDEHRMKLKEIIRKNDLRTMRVVGKAQLEMLGRSGTPSLSAAFRDAAENLASNATARTASRTMRILRTAITMIAEDETADRGIEYAKERLKGGQGQRRARTIADTEGHRAGSAAIRIIGESMGDQAWKQWMTRTDRRVRESHRRVHRVAIHTNDQFHVGDDYLDFPGDPNGSAKETINCRCFMKITPRRPKNARSQQ